MEFIIQLYYKLVTLIPRIGRLTMFKSLTNFFRAVSVEANKISDQLDVKIEKEEKKLVEIRKDFEEHERKSAVEGGFDTVEKWREHMEEIRKNLLK